MFSSAKILPPFVLNFSATLRTVVTISLFLYHTKNEKIQMKRSAWANRVPLLSKDDKGWITITSPEQLFRLNVDMDFHRLKYSPP